MDHAAVTRDLHMQRGIVGEPVFPVDREPEEADVNSRAFASSSILNGHWLGELHQAFLYGRSPNRAF
jgi:hypothetical protein